jgi:hypothetical protein
LEPLGWREPVPGPPGPHERSYNYEQTRLSGLALSLPAPPVVSADEGGRQAYFVIVIGSPQVTVSNLVGGSGFIRTAMAKP